MLFTLKWLTSVFPNNKGIDERVEIDTVFIDSRKEVTNGLFVPIVGERFDGHQFVLGAIENGATAVLWEKTKPFPKDFPSKIAVFFVEDTTEALQHLAHEYKNVLNPKVIGITGSNGKTTTKDLVSAVVQSTYKTHYTKGNFNNHIGLPLTILSMPRDTEVLVLEMGMSDYGEIDLLSKIAEPELSIITNIGESHIEFLGSQEGIARAKLEIRNGMPRDGKLIIDGDEPLLSSLSREDQVITCGFQSHNDVKIEHVRLSVEGTTFTLSDKREYSVSLLGNHHAKNACFAIAVGKLLNIPEDKIKTSLLEAAYTGMRFEFLEGKKGVTIVNDAYNASPTSMIGAIEIVRSLSNFKQKVLVLGDIFELGSFGEQYHRQIGEQIIEPITAVFTYGELAEEISKVVQEKEKSIIAKHVKSEDELFKVLDPFLTEESIVLFKASRGMAFEKFVEKLITKQ